MAGRRHHTIPRFLLKGFASSWRGDEVNVWMYRRNANGIELNIRNVGVEKDFYGQGCESDLDDQITALETQYALLLDELRSQKSIGARLSDERIPCLIAHLCLRTRHLRQSALSAFDFMLKGIQDYLAQPEVLQRAVRRELGTDDAFCKRVTAYVVERGLPLDKAEQIATLLLEKRESIQELVLESLPKAAESANCYLSRYRSVLPDALRAGFIESMSRNLNAELRVQSYRKYNWFVVSVKSPILLGDSACLFETSGKRRFKTIDEQGDSVRRVFLPVSSNRVLIGTPTAHLPEVDLLVLNKAIARCSCDFFVSSRRLSSSESHLCKAIGRWSGILSCRELTVLIDEFRKSWPKAG